MEGARLKRGQLPQESYMSYSRIGHFCHIFYMVSMHRYFFLLLLSIQYTHTNVLQKSACQNLKY